MRHALISIAAIALTAPLWIVRPAMAQPTQPQADLNWDNVGQMLSAEERQGFSGTVLLVRDGEVVLNEGYGMADREHHIPNTPDTIFATGSSPIDFTWVAALQLIASGKLSQDDPVTKFFDNIPSDKRGITVGQILNSATGLPDFPDIRGVDADPDHSPLTRDEFIQRFRDAKLHFEPGTSEEHSHFAWGLLAAIVEVASGERYPDYVREHVFKPAGMTRSGSNGDQFPGETVAIGYGARTWGKVNTPPQWGATSWLVMGSGGMVGTTGDMYRFEQALGDGTLLPESVRDLYPARGASSNGDDFGFENVYNHGFDNLVYIFCNSSDPDGGRGYNMQPIAEQLLSLATGRPVRKFSIGIAMGTHPDNTVFVDRVLPGSPAEKAGLKEGDVLVSANGTEFNDDDPLQALRPGVENGETLKIVVNRDGKTLTLTLKPEPRGS